MKWKQTMAELMMVIPRESCFRTLPILFAYSFFFFFSSGSGTSVQTIVDIAENISAHQFF